MAKTERKLGQGRASKRANETKRERKQSKGDSRGGTVVGVIRIISVMLFGHAECLGNAERRTR